MARQLAGGYIWKMRHPQGRRRSRWNGSVPACATLVWAVLVSACSDEDRVFLIGPTLAPEAPELAGELSGPEPAMGPPPEAPPLQADLTPPPRSCSTELEWVSLGTSGQEYGLEWVPATSQSSYFFYNLVFDPYDDSDESSTPFRWSSAEGAAALEPGEPPPDSSSPAVLRLIGVSDDGNALVARIYDEVRRYGGIRWTRDREPVWLEFSPSWQTPDGAAVLGCRSGLMRWTESTGSQRLAEVCGSGLRSSRAGDVVVSHVSNDAGQDRPFLWTETGGGSFLVPADAPGSRTRVGLMNERGDVLAGWTRAPEQSQVRAFRWTPSVGLQDLGDLPGMPEGADVIPTGMSDDGRVIVGKVDHYDLFRGRRRVNPMRTWSFRWTEATGMQDISADERNSVPSFISVSGDVVIGDIRGFDPGVFRWTEATGSVDLGADVLIKSVAFDGDLLLGVNDEGPRTLTFGKLAGTEPQIAARVPAGPVPEGWSLRQLEGISADGRLVYGSTLTPADEVESWLLHLRERCTVQ